jgi:UDP-N-acetylglucosamine 2-epimerase (non-hydrolysing)
VIGASKPNVLEIHRQAAEGRHVKRIAVVYGTRPEIVKLAGVLRMLGPRAFAVHTGQHYSPALSDVFLTQLRLERPEVQLEIGGTSRGRQIGEATARLDECFSRTAPLAVVVQGDTNTALAGALAANARGIPLVHVEAGLRSFDRAMPEEHNRVVVDHLADLCCAPTETSRANLLAEGIAGDRVAVTGNTVVDVVPEILPNPAEQRALLHAYGVEEDHFVLATFHRPENVDTPEVLAVILDELAALPAPVVLPLHPRTAARAAAFGFDGKLAQLRVVEPLGYREFLGLAAQSAMLVSDSGGVQEEASVIKRPVVVVRNSTERPEVQGTFAELVAPGPDIGAVAGRWWAELDALHTRLAATPSPYGPGDASARTVEAVDRLLESRSS